MVEYLILDKEFVSKTESMSKKLGAAVTVAASLALLELNSVLSYGGLCEDHVGEDCVCG